MDCRWWSIERSISNPSTPNTRKARWVEAILETSRLPVMIHEVAEVIVPEVGPAPRQS